MTTITHGTRQQQETSRTSFISVNGVNVLDEISMGVPGGLPVKTQLCWLVVPQAGKTSATQGSLVKVDAKFSLAIHFLNKVYGYKVKFDDIEIYN